MNNTILTAAAQEFNVEAGVLIDFLKEEFEKDLKPLELLTPEMYDAIEGKYADNLAERKIRQCISTKNPYLDIGNCKLSDKDLNRGSRLSFLLKQCTHVRTLIISNSWFDEDEKSWKNSFNRQEPNQFTVLPASIPALKNLEKLVCCGYSLESLYSLRRWSIKELFPLSQLTNLQYLDLSHNRIVTIRGLENLRRLRVLNLYSNVFTKIEGLEALTQLQKLNLSKNKITEIKGLEALTQLQELSLYNNQLTEIRGLEDLFQLQILNLSLNQLTEVKGLKTLSQLQILYLHSNQLTEIKGLETLSRLQQLYLYSNQLTEIKELRNLTQLQELYLHHNQLTEIKGLKTLGLLQILDLHDNQLAEIKGLETLSELRHLNLSNNQLAEVKGLEVLSQLRHLNLSNNRLIDIKGLEFVSRKDESFNLFIYDNPFLKEYGLDLKPYENHLRFIKELLLRQNSKKQQRFIYPLKVLMLGNHGVGKSSLVNYLTGTKAKISSTHILRIENYWLQSADKNKIPDVIFYDFGGQDFYHGLYRAFISPGSLQIIVFEASKDKNTPDEDSDKYNIINYNRQYWLGQKNYKERNKEPDNYIMVQTFASAENAKEAPHLTHTGKGYLMSFFLSFPQPGSKQAKMEDPFFETGRAYFKAFFEKQVRQLQKENIRDEAQWYAGFIKYILDKQGKNYRPSSLSNIIKEGHYKPEGASEQDQLESLQTNLVTLHRHGLVLYYHNDEKLKDIVWLNPEKLVQHVQKNILPKDKMSNYNGRIKEKGFEKLANDINILRMLRRQKVIFLHQPNKSNPETNEYIIPNYLPLALENDPDYQLLTFGLGQPDFIIKFNDFIPFGFINQMICFYGQQPDAKKFWRNQLLFTISKKAENDEEEKKINIRIAKVLIQLDFEKLDIKVYSQLLSDPQFGKRAITEYLFFSLMALYRDDIEDEHIPDYEAFYTYKNELNTRIGIKSQLTISELLGLPHDNTHISTDMTDRNIWQRIYEEPDNIPEDVYISIKDERYISYYDLVKLEGIVKIKSYNINKENNRINTENVEEIPVNDFVAFNNKLSIMKRVFISYSHNDAAYLATLRTYLVNLEREGLIQTWQDGLIQAGDDWDQKIKEGLQHADICIMLLSQDFIASNYVHEVEFQTIMEKRQTEDCRIIPVLIKDCDWKNWKVYPKEVADKMKNKNNKDYAIGTFQFLPHDSTKLLPLYRWTHPEEAWMQVIETIRDFC